MKVCDRDMIAALAASDAVSGWEVQPDGSFDLLLYVRSTDDRIATVACWDADRDLFAVSVWCHDGRRLDGERLDEENIAQVASVAEAIRYIERHLRAPARGEEDACASGSAPPLTAP